MLFNTGSISFLFFLPFSSTLAAPLRQPTFSMRPAASNPAKKQKVDHAQLAAIKNVSKRGLVQVLKKLDEMNLLNDSFSTKSDHSLRRNFQTATEAAGQTKTPYGTVVQQMKLPSQSLPYWDYIHPMAYMVFLCSISPEMFDVMSQVTMFSLLLYVDEINPGNPLHPMPGRKMQGIYWALAEWPQWLLQRKDSWPCFGVIRTTVCKELPGYMSQLMKLVLRIFFAPKGVSFRNGCVVHHGTSSHMFFLKFCGFISDEKSLKEVFDIKGQSGKFPCIACYNVAYKRMKGKDNIVNVTSTDPSLWKYRSKAIMEEMLDRIREAPDKLQEQLEINYGINYNQHGILFDIFLWSEVLSGPDSYLRNAMHTISSNGVGGTEVAEVVQALNAKGVSIELLQQFARLWVLPKAKGKITEMYFKEELLASDHVRHFASQVLTMIHIQYGFLEEKIRPRGWLLENINCFSKLHEIVTLLRLGIGGVDYLDEVCLAHAVLFEQLYSQSSIKIKFHHLLHLASDLKRIGKMVSCFVTERKHLDIRECSVGVMRFLEHSVANSFLNKTVENCMTESNNFMPKFLLKPKAVSIPGTDISSCSESATFECGTIHKDDIVLMRDLTVSQVIGFWQSGSEISVRVNLFQPVGGNTWKKRVLAITFVHADDIVEPLPYYEPMHGHIRIAPLGSAYDKL